MLLNKRLRSERSVCHASTFAPTRGHSLSLPLLGPTEPFQGRLFCSAQASFETASRNVTVREKPIGSFLTSSQRWSRDQPLFGDVKCLEETNLLSSTYCCPFLLRLSLTIRAAQQASLPVDSINWNMIHHVSGSQQ